VLRLPRHDVVICLTTPRFVALIGALLKAVKGTRLILWAMDIRVRPGLSGIGSIVFRGEVELMHGHADPGRVYDGVIAP